MKKILIPIDFSNVSIKCLEYAALISDKVKLEITLLNVIYPSSLAIQKDGGIDELAMTHTREDAEKMLNEWCEKYKNENRSISYVIKEGFVVDGVLEASKEINPDMLILGTIGASGFMGNLMGSNASAILNRIIKPVLLVPHDATVSEFKNLVYATQLESIESEALQRVFEFANIFDCKVDLIKVNTDYQLDIFDDESIISQLHKLFPEKDFKIYKETASTTLKGIEHFIENHKVDLIIMTTSRQSFIERLFNGSVTRQMALHTNIPLLVYHKEDLPHY